MPDDDDEEDVEALVLCLPKERVFLMMGHFLLKKKSERDLLCIDG